MAKPMTDEHLLEIANFWKDNNQDTKLTSEKFDKAERTIRENLQKARNKGLLEEVQTNTSGDIPKEVLQETVDSWIASNEVYSTTASILGVSSTTIRHRIVYAEETYGMVTKAKLKIKSQPTKNELQRVVDVWKDSGQNATLAAKKLNISPTTVRRRLEQAETLSKMVSQNIVAKSDKKVFVITSAQDDTPVFKGFFDNLLAYVKYRDAELIIGGFTYQKGLFESHMVDTGTFEEELRPYMVNEKRYITEKLCFVGNANILPTTANPLTGWETMSGEAWTIIPHAKIRLKTVPTMIESDSKVIMSTGVVTEPNYTKRSAGQKAEFHHTFGAVIVEVREDGRFHTRHINATQDGAFQDLTIQVENGVVTDGHNVEVISWGDDHHAKLEQSVIEAQWTNEDSIANVLKPKEQHHQDLLDFEYRNHHNRDDSHFKAEMYVKGTESIRKEVEGCADFINSISIGDCKHVIIESNHDTALTRWLKDPNVLQDPANVMLWHELNYEWHYNIYINEGDDRFNPFEHLMEDSLTSNYQFVREGESYRICEDVGSPIECGLHGHIGPNGSRGSSMSFSKMPVKTNTAHSHSPAMIDGNVTSGVSASYRMGYNEKGASSWLRANNVVYPNGKRTLVFVDDSGDWRAHW